MEFRTGRSIPSISSYGRLVHEVCLTHTGGIWQARIMTLPKQVWVEPGGTRVLCFEAATAAEAEAMAVDFIQRDVVSRGHRLENHLAATGIHTPVEPARRVSVHVPVRYRQVRGPLDEMLRRSYVATTGNLSESGLFIVTPSILRPRTLINIELRLPGIPTRLHGEVMWARPEARPGMDKGMGVRLMAPSLEYRARLQSL